MEYVSLLLTVLVVIGSALVNGQTVNGGHSANIPRNSDAVVFPESWVSDMFDKALVNFTVRGVGSPSCQEHSELYERNLGNYTSWAVKSKYLVVLNYVQNIIYKLLYLIKY